MPTWEIVGLIILGITVFILSIRYGFFGLLLDIFFAMIGSSKSSKGGGSSFGGGDSGGGGSNSDW